MTFKAFPLIFTILFLSFTTSLFSKNSIEEVLVGPLYTLDSNECTPGDSCDDGDPCTSWDQYDFWCNCSGTFQDEDNDGVCDAKDECPNGDDNLDENDNNVPDNCEKKINNCSECEVDSNGEITICWIPTNKYNLKTIRGSCTYLHKFFDDNGNLEGKSQCGPCDCAMIGDTDTDGDGICDSNDDCPEKPNVGPCGCDDQDSDGDGICDSLDQCPDHDDNEDLDGDGVPDGCDLCPENPELTTEVGPCGCNDQDSDGDGVCDLEDCFPENNALPTTPGSSCDDNDDTTENDAILEDGCTCQGTLIELCEISAVIDDLICDDNGTPSNADDDTYTFSLTASLISGESQSWEGSFSNSYLGAFAIGATPYGEKISIGPIPAGSFTPSNVAPPIIIEGGLSLDIQVNATGNLSCTDSRTVDSPGSCACDDSDEDGVCDDDDICQGSDDNIDSDGDGTPDGCDECINNPDKTEAGICGCDDIDSDGDGICDSDDCSPENPDLPSDIITSCDDGDPNTDNDVYAVGSCDCRGEIIVCPDGDSDGTCDEDDICTGHPDGIDTDGDGTPDGCDECPNNADKTEAGDCGCDDMDTDGDGICDSVDQCPGFDDFEDDDNDGYPNGCDQCPDNGDKSEAGDCGCDDKDSDDDGICDALDCNPNSPGLPSTFVISCDDGDPNTINDIYAIGSCECIGEPIGGCTDTDEDGVCDEDDLCPGYDDNNDFDNDGIPNKCDCSPTSPGLPSTFVISCDDGNPNTINDIYAIGSCECIGEPIVGCTDTDNDGVCDEDDICNGYDDNIDSDDDDIPDGCDCKPNSPGLPSTFVISCDDGDPNTINDVYAIGSCECIGEPIGGCTDSDEDGVCDEDDLCPGYDDNNDFDNDGIPNKCDCSPTSPGLPSTFVISCDDGDPNTINDVYAIGSCECIGEAVGGCADSDNDGVCDEDDICNGYNDSIDSDEDGTPDGCDDCPDDSGKTRAGECGCDDCPSDTCDIICTPDNAVSEYEWIDEISINQLENQTGENGGYADFRDMSISLGHGDVSIRPTASFE